MKYGQNANLGLTGEKKKILVLVNKTQKCA